MSVVKGSLGKIVVEVVAIPSSSFSLTVLQAPGLMGRLIALAQG